MRFERVILAMGVLSAVGFGSAAMAIDPLDAISVCSRLNKKDSRLECYDQVAQDAAAGRLQSSAPVYAPAPAPSVRQGGWDQPPVGGAPAPRAQAQGAAGFGATSLPRSDDQRREESGPDSISAQAASSTDNGLGQWRIRLADGAIWQMTERVALFRPPAPNESVTIRRGAMGGFLMDVGKQASVRVTRVR